jgi:hypothetical protein
MLVVLIVSNNTANIPVAPYKEEKKLVPIDFQQALKHVDKSELETNLRYLCSSALEGRMSGMKGNDIAAKWIQQKFNSFGLTTKLQSFQVQALNEHKEKSSQQTANIIAVLPGNHLTLKDEVIVVGAHMDHIGYGPAMSQAAHRREIHPGADDNASGTVNLLEISRILSILKGQNNRTIVFIAFSGEEMGLYGAKHYVNNPLYSNMIFMLNMDMVGRYRGQISCLSANDSPEIKSICESLTQYRPHCTSGSGGGSDHVPFYQKRIPICFLHSGGHDDYHTPDDTPDKINYDGLVLVTKFAIEIIWQVDKLPNKPSFIGVVKQDQEFLDHDWRKK